MPTVLVVSPITENRERLQQALHGTHWKIQGVQTYRETLAVLRREWPHVIICECPLADGSWKDLLSLVAPLLDAPLLIVTSRSADDYLWSEVLNMGGHDVLVQPLEDNEIVRVVGAAGERWANRRRQWKLSETNLQATPGTSPPPASVAPSPLTSAASARLPAVGKAS